jgi:MFS family permease
MMVGIGVATVVPTLFSIAGKNPNLPPGESITIVSSVSFLGFLIGPPIIGYIAEVFGLRFSFAFIGLFGVLIFFLVQKIKLND